MPVCELFIISLARSISIHTFLSLLRAHSIKPLVQSRVVRWIILPTTTSTAALLAQNHHWDLLIILEPGQSALPKALDPFITATWSCSCGIPSRITNSFHSKNETLLHPPSGSVPAASLPRPNADSSQALALSPELASWIDSLSTQNRSHPVSMLNLLAFKPEPSAKEAYKRYGAAFAAKIGSRHGGDAKIVGHVVGGQAKSDSWDEVALAHYPSLVHFAAMLGSADYQAINQTERLGALKDTFILCTMEIDDNGELVGGDREANAIKSSL
jgi:hypothetical protein